MSALSNLPPESGPPWQPPRWLRIALWLLAFALGSAAVVVIGVAALLHSQRFHEYVLIKVRQSATESLGVPVELQNCALHFSGISPTADLYGLVVHGAAPYANPPLLQAEHVKIGIRVISLLGRRWYFSELTVQHAVLQIHVDADGNNNLPKGQQRSTSSGVQTLFDLAIRRVALYGSEIYYNDRRSELDADLRDLMLNAAFDPSRNTYAGQVAYSDAHVTSDGYAPIPHGLSAEFAMTPTHLDVRKAELHSGASTIAFTATVDDFDNPRVATVYHASVDASALRRLLNIPQLPIGMAVLDGHAEYAAKPNQPALNAITVNGTLRSSRLGVLVPIVRTRTVQAELGAVRASYALVNGDLEVRSLSASLLSGKVDARATLRDLAGEQVGAAQVKLDGISLRSLQELAGTSVEDDLTIGGTFAATGSASWKRSLRSLQIKADASVDAAVGSKPSSETFPVTGELHGSFQNSDQMLTLTQSYLRTSQSILTLDGSMGQRSHINLALNAGNLHEVETIARIFLPPARPLGLFGSATFTGTLSGPTSEPRLTGELSSTNVRLRGTDWRLLRAHLDVSPSAVEIRGGQLEPASPKAAAQGNIALSGRAELQHWSFTTASHFQLALKARHLDAAQLARLAAAPTRVSGSVNAELQAHGTEMNPVGQGEVELVRATVDGEPIQSAHVQFNGDGSAAHANLNITMPSGVTTGSVTYYPNRRGYEARLETHNFKLDQLQAVKSRHLSLAGVMNLVANGRGTLDDPQLTASIDIPQLQAQGQTIDHIALQANVAQHVATISLDTRAVNANIHGRATVQLTGNYLADAVLDTQPIPLQPLLVTYAPDMASHLSGQTELHATMKGPLKHRERIEAHVVIPALNMHYDQSIDLAAAGPIHADYANGVLELARSGLKGTGTDLQFQGSIPLLDRSRPVSLLLLGSVDLRLAQLFDPDVTSAGQLQFNINTYGTQSDPNVRGTVRIANASFSVIDLPVGLSNGNGTLALTGDRLDITNFEGTVGGGKITARGGVLYHPSLRFDLALSGEGIRMLYPDGVREGVSANLTLTGTPEQAVLRGQVNVDQLSFTPDFDLSSITSFESGGAEEPPSRGFLSDLQLNVAVRSTQNVNAVSRTVSVNGSANLRLTGTAAQPVVLGRINLTGGDLIFQGNRYVLQNGVIDFVNPTRTEPNINASLTTTILQYNIGLRFEGQLDRLRTSYSSTPALPPADIINLIAFGKTQEAANATATTANQTAEQSIASAVSSQVTNRVQNFVGLSQLSVDPTLGTSQQNAGAIITVQKRVTSKIFVTFSTDVTGTQQDVVQLEYQVTPRVSLSGTRDQNGGFGFDTRITREW